MRLLTSFAPYQDKSKLYYNILNVEIETFYIGEFSLV